VLPLHDLDATTTNHHEPVEPRDPTPPLSFEAKVQATVVGNPTTMTQTTPQLSQTQSNRELSPNSAITTVDKGRGFNPIFWQYTQYFSNLITIHYFSKTNY